MPGTTRKCSHCQRPKEKAKIECSCCKHWFSYCCTGVSAGDEVLVSVTTPFYCSQWSSTDRQQSSLQTTIRCHHCHSQTDSGRKLTTQCSKCNLTFHLSCTKMSKSHADSFLGWFCNTCDPIINSPHSSRTSTSNTHPLDSPSFGALIQSLRSCNHPIPKGACSSFASGLNKLINKAISSNALLDWQRLLCFPLSVLSSGSGPKGISLTSSIKSRINTYLESDSLPKPEVSPRHATPQPNNAHRDPATNMKSLVNQKLSDFNIKSALQILSGDSSFVNPNKESLDILQQKHPQLPPDLMLPPSPSAATPPTYFSQNQI